MKRYLNIRTVAVFGFVILGFVLLRGGVLFAQRAPDKKLFINGQSTNVAVLQVNGRSYIDVETVAQITNGSVKFGPNQVALTIPNTDFDAGSPQDSARLSKDFASSAISTVAEMKEWKGTLGTLVKFGLAVTIRGRRSITNAYRRACSKRRSPRQPMRTTMHCSC